ncbi:hypothetical protein SU69_08640 [Thermosipho melanesiensis]|uniref:Uncharacterized protein n=2 Tax=Thermosipho melanesiensis TaxID=46541 RepID=A6LNP7_THEM4|nr:DsrE family protein [Thermosipho melanesiensis]ABR31548.1 protein of unknown function DUF1291 [Thermosipho melanesiensis BI429]APT74584.1 hypothetical protein BW47_09015 [Thermosipho melanesiensis]OOC35289.1 hypothetical protein SU69_08640 [Thermosipho melanesiensis]OOC35508.1 hypothetical protein SU70_08650 [Thermosipho melanesiensis]OOC36544.1 hypothetical protein SU68_08705 [Thermosipho melanesiensis]
MNKLAIIWATAEKGIFDELIFPYAYNSRKQNWWDEVILVIWGPSEILVANDDSIKAKLQNLKNTGVKILACKWCADNHKISSNLTEIAEVIYVGQPVTHYLQNNYKVLTF